MDCPTNFGLLLLNFTRSSVQLGKMGKTREDLCMDDEVLAEYRMVLVKHGTEQR